MRRVKFKLEDESLESQRTAGRYNPAKVCCFRLGPHKLAVVLGAGTSDDVDVFTHHGEGIILNSNRGLDYCGVEVYDREGKQVGSCFMQSDERIKEALGPRGLDLKDTTIATRLLDYVGDRIR